MAVGRGVSVETWMAEWPGGILRILIWLWGRGGLGTGDYRENLGSGGPVGRLWQKGLLGKDLLEDGGHRTRQGTRDSRWEPAAEVKTVDCAGPP